MGRPAKVTRAPRVAQVLRRAPRVRIRYLIDLAVGAVLAFATVPSAALAGLVCRFYVLSGYRLHAQGLELDAIAAVVIGGTLLAGGSGDVIGTPSAC